VSVVVELREQLEVEVELAIGAGCCRWCGHGSVQVKDRPPVAIGAVADTAMISSTLGGSAGYRSPLLRGRGLGDSRHRRRSAAVAGDVQQHGFQESSLVGADGPCAAIRTE
jgi:hypothetical protein